MKHRKGNPVLIRGTLYPSGVVAALALGVTKQAIYQALERGTIDKVGLFTHSTMPKPVTVDGVRYPSIQKAARVTGIPYSTLRDRVARQS